MNAIRKLPTSYQLASKSEAAEEAEKKDLDRAGKILQEIREQMRRPLEVRIKK